MGDCTYYCISSLRAILTFLGSEKMDILYKRHIYKQKQKNTTLDDYEKETEEEE